MITCWPVRPAGSLFYGSKIPTASGWLKARNRKLWTACAGSAWSTTKGRISAGLLARTASQSARRSTSTTPGNWWNRGMHITVSVLPSGWNRCARSSRRRKNLFIMTAPAGNWIRTRPPGGSRPVKSMSSVSRCPRKAQPRSRICCAAISPSKIAIWTITSSSNRMGWHYTIWRRRWMTT